MMYRIFFAVLINLGLALQPAFADQASSERSTTNANPLGTEQAFRDMMHVSVDSKLEFFDESKEPISFDQFGQLVTQGKRFSISKEPQRAVVQITEATAVAETENKSKSFINLSAGDLFPDFRMPTVNGEDVDSQTLHGRYTLINFYFSECSPCVAEIPRLNQFAATHTDINVLAVTFDSRSETQRFVKMRKFTWPVISDARAFMKKLGLKVSPVFVLLDPNGHVVSSDFPSAHLAENWKLTDLEEWIRQGSDRGNTPESLHF